MKNKKSITIGGLKLQVKENKKNIENKHKKFFLSTLNTLISIPLLNIYVYFFINSIKTGYLSYN